MNRLWINCKSVKELKKTYKTYKNLCNTLDEEFKNIIKFPKKGWENTFNALEILRKIIKEEAKDDFDLEKEKYIWIFCYTDGSKRAELLGITKKHYNSKKIAKQWRNKFLKLIAPDKNNQSIESNIATAKLNELYQGMIKYGK